MRLACSDDSALRFAQQKFHKTMDNKTIMIHGSLEIVLLSIVL